MMTHTDKKKDSQNTTSVSNSNETNQSFLKMADNRPESIQQQKIIDNISQSPLMVAQKKIIQKIGGKEEEEDPKVKSLKAIQAKVNDASSTVFSKTIQKKDNDTGLPDNLKSGVENLSGMSLDHVKVHYSSDKPAQLNAHAYAQGSEIHVAPGQEKHVPHEAWHVVQQMQGRVQPTVQMEGVAINDDVSLETEADVMGAKALNN